MLLIDSIDKTATVMPEFFFWCLYICPRLEYTGGVFPGFRDWRIGAVLERSSGMPIEILNQSYALDVLAINDDRTDLPRRISLNVWSKRRGGKLSMDVANAGKRCDWEIPCTPS